MQNTINGTWSVVEKGKHWTDALFLAMNEQCCGLTHTKSNVLWGITFFRGYLIWRKGGKNG